MNQRLEEKEIRERLGEVAPWTEKGGRLYLECRLKGFAEALALVNRIAALAEHANHHPDITLRWNRVLLELSTHSAGGLTVRDFELAPQLLAEVRAAGAEIVS